MKGIGRLLGVALGFGVGVAITGIYLSQPREVEARTDRYEDYVMATGAVATNLNVPTDGVWLLDYRTGRLLGTVIDRDVGRIVGWAQVDLVTEFQIPPRQDVHFLMTTGNIARGQAALYVAEVKTGRFGVYTMAPGPNGFGIQIVRHDLTTFRPEQEQPAAEPPMAPGAVPIIEPLPGG